MARFLSDEWIEEMAGAARAASGEPPEALHDVRFALQQVVRTADGEVRYGLRLADGTVEVVAGELPGADVRLTTDGETAVAIATGALAAQDAVAAGRLHFNGDVPAMIQHAPALAALDEVFAEVRASTSYD